MDELDLRRRCLATPHDDDAAFREALADSPALQQAARHGARLQQQLQSALDGTSVPEGLDDRILLRLGLQQRRRRRWVAGLALAASLLIGLSVALWPTPQGGFGQMALDHVYSEISHLDHLPTSTVADSTLATLVREVGAELDGPLQGVRFAYICPTPQGPGLHLITDGPEGPVTVLYVPGAEGGGQDFGDDRFTGRTMAMPGGGLLAVIGESTGDVDAVQHSLRQQLRWPRRAGRRLPPADERAV